MTDAMISVDGGELTFAQASAIHRLINQLGAGHWHFNDCRCCVTVHGADCAYTIGRDGTYDYHAGRGCDCPPDPPPSRTLGDGAVRALTEHGETLDRLAKHEGGDDAAA